MVKKRLTSKDETKINVHNVSLGVEKQVGIVSVSHLQQMSHQAVPSKRLHKILLSLLVRRSVSASECKLEVILETSPARHGGALLHTVEGNCSFDELDEAGVGSRGDDLIRVKINVQALYLKNVLANVNDLHGQKLLAKIVSTLDDERLDGPARQVAKG